MVRNATIVAVLMVFAAWPGIAGAEELTIPLPQFVRQYAYEAFPPIIDPGPIIIDSPPPIYTGLPLSSVQGVRITLRGSVVPGLIRGDGNTVPAQDIALRGGFVVRFFVGHMGVLDTASATEGTFERTLTFNGPFELSFVVHNGVGDETFNPVVGVGLEADPVAMGLSQPPTDPSAVLPFVPWWPGYTIVTPLTGGITDAFMTIETSAVPEPAALGLLAAAGLLGWRRRG